VQPDAFAVAKDDPTGLVLAIPAALLVRPAAAVWGVNSSADSASSAAAIGLAKGKCCGTTEEAKRSAFRSANGDARCIFASAFLAAIELSGDSRAGAARPATGSTIGKFRFVKRGFGGEALDIHLILLLFIRRMPRSMT
jgi:hypothetical protein